MAFSVGQRVRVADQSSGYRGMSGIVKVVTDDVRLDGHACTGRIRFLTGQLKVDGTVSALSYAQCSS